MVYEKLGIVSKEERDCELNLFSDGIEAETQPGVQVELFRDLLLTLNNNEQNRTFIIDKKLNRVNKLQVLGVVEDSEISDPTATCLLLRPFLIE